MDCLGTRWQGEEFLKQTTQLKICGYSKQLLKHNIIALQCIIVGVEGLETLENKDLKKTFGNS